MNFTKEKMKFTKKDIYVRKKLFSARDIFGISVIGAGILSIVIDFGRWSVLTIQGVLIAIMLLFRIKGGAEYMEIHGDMITYRNSRWKKREFSIYDIWRIESSKDKEGRIILCGKDGSELASLEEHMEEVRIALLYLESRAVPIEEGLLVGWPYEEYYDANCKKTKTILSINYGEEIDVCSMEFGRRRTKYLIKQEASNRKEAKKAAKRMLPNWKIRRRKFKKKSIAMEWLVSKKYVVSVAGEKESALRLARLRHCCMLEGIPVRKVLETKEEKPYVLENGWFGEVKEVVNEFSELTGRIKNKEEGDRYCYEAGVGLARYQNVLLTHREFIKTDEPWNKKEYRSKRVLTAKKLPLEKEKLEELLAEVECVCSAVNKVCVPVADIKSIMSHKNKILFSDTFLEATTENEVSVWVICNYMASLATHTYYFTRGILSKCWCDYVQKMVEGYESIRPLTQEEKACIPALLRLAVVLQMAEVKDDEIVREKLVQLYQFLEQ